MTWFPPRSTKKSNLTVAVSLRKRDIFFVSLEEYKVACPSCHVVNGRRIRCEKCGAIINTDRTLKGNRPVIVVSSPIMNLESRDAAMVLVIPITKNSTNYPDSVIIPANLETKLELPSNAHVFALTSCDKNWFFEESRMGRVGDKEWSQIEAKLKELIGIDSNKILVGTTALTGTDIKEILESRKKCKEENDRLILEKLEITAQLKSLRDTYEGKLNSQRKYNELLNKNNKKLEVDLEVANTKIAEIEKYKN